MMKKSWSPRWGKNASTYKFSAGESHNLDGPGPRQGCWCAPCLAVSPRVGTPSVFDQPKPYSRGSNRYDKHVLLTGAMASKFAPHPENNMSQTQEEKKVKKLNKKIGLSIKKKKKKYGREKDEKTQKIIKGSFMSAMSWDVLKGHSP